MKRIKKYVLDSYAILAYLEGEKGADIVAKILKDAVNNKAEIYMCLINFGEVYYIILREQGKEAAQLYLQTMERYPITIFEVSKSLTLGASEIKAFNKLSYADAFAAATAKNLNARLVTGDKEFTSLQRELKIVWL